MAGKENMEENMGETYEGQFGDQGRKQPDNEREKSGTKAGLGFKV